MTEYMKGNGTQINDMVEDMRDIPIAIFIKESLKWEKLMAKADTNGPQVERFMMENGLKE